MQWHSPNSYYTHRVGQIWIGIGMRAHYTPRLKCLTLRTLNQADVISLKLDSLVGLSECPTLLNWICQGWLWYECTIRLPALHSFSFLWWGCLYQGWGPWKEQVFLWTVIMMSCVSTVPPWTTLTSSCTCARLCEETNIATTFSHTHQGHVFWPPISWSVWVKAVS